MLREEMKAKELLAKINEKYKSYFNQVNMCFNIEINDDLDFIVQFSSKIENELFSKFNELFP